MSRYQIKQDGIAKCGGPMTTFPNAAERASLKRGGCKIYVDGKLYKEGDNGKQKGSGSKQV